MQNMWVADMEKKVDGAEPAATVQKWPKHCIFRVPPHFKAGNNVFKPQKVALGPFHHRDAVLRPMEGHKLRAVQHLLRRAGKALGNLAAAVEGVAADLEDAYAELGGEWRGKNRDRFLQMMIADGCFLLEFMRNYTREKRREKIASDYSPNDPVFGPHAVVHIGLFVLRDVLLIENQLPLILLRTIVAVESGQTPSDLSINKLVLDFLCLDPKRTTDVSPRLGLHPLDLYRRSLLLRPSSTARAVPNDDDQADALPIRVTREAPPDDDGDDDDKPAAEAAPRSAQKLWEAGIRFRRSRAPPDRLDNIRFFRASNNCRLEMPKVVLDDSSEYKYRNLMAFEALHAGAGGNDVTAFVLFMRDLVDSAADVELLRRKGILDHDLAGSDRAVVALLNRLTRDVAKIDRSRSRLCGIRGDMESYCVDRSWACRVLICESWAKLRTSHLSNIWTFIALLAGIFLLGTDVVQTVYAVRSYELEKRTGGPPPPPPPPPHRGRWTVHY